MLLTGIFPLRFLLNLILSVMLFSSMDLSFGQQMEGGAPFFNDSGSVTLPPESIEEMQEAMPELNLFPPQNPSQMLPEPGDPLEGPDL
jgi:hypothetical protein